MFLIRIIGRYIRQPDADCAVVVLQDNYECEHMEISI